MPLNILLPQAKPMDLLFSSLLNLNRIWVLPACFKVVFPQITSLIKDTKVDFLGPNVMVWKIYNNGQLSWKEMYMHSISQDGQPVCN